MKDFQIVSKASGNQAAIQADFNTTALLSGLYFSSFLATLSAYTRRDDGCGNFRFPMVILKIATGSSNFRW
jgi:hypothetical protein